MPTLNAISHLLFAKSQKPASPAPASTSRRRGEKRGEPKAKGFTLIELLVVIAIIGILATFVVASFTSAQARGRDSRRKSDLDAIKKALELFRNDTAGSASYPLGPEASLAGAIAPAYIRVLPSDPSTVLNYDYGGGLRAGGACVGNTILTATCDDYRLVATLENTSDQSASASQTKCPNAYGVTAYTANSSYVVCAD